MPKHAGEPWRKASDEEFQRFHLRHPAWIEVARARLPTCYSRRCPDPAIMPAEIWLPQPGPGPEAQRNGTLFSEGVWLVWVARSVELDTIEERRLAGHVGWSHHLPQGGETAGAPPGEDAAFNKDGLLVFSLGELPAALKDCFLVHQDDSHFEPARREVGEGVSRELLARRRREEALAKAQTGRKSEDLATLIGEAIKRTNEELENALRREWAGKPEPREGKAGEAPQASSADETGPPRPEDAFRMALHARRLGGFAAHEGRRFEQADDALRHELQAALKRARPSNFSWQDESADIVVLCCPLPFYGEQVKWVWLIDRRGRRSRSTRFVFWPDWQGRGHARFIPLSGGSAEIHLLNAQCQLRLTPAHATAYLRFFCESVNGEDGAFLVLEKPGDLPWLPGAKPEDKQAVQRAFTAVQGWQLVARQDGSESESYFAWTFVGYGRFVFAAVFRIEPGGYISMEADEQACSSDGLAVVPLNFNSEFEFVLRGLAPVGDDETPRLEAGA